MKRLLLLCITLGMTACSSLPHERSSVRESVGESGVFTRPIGFSAKSPTAKESWKRCSPSELVDIRWTHSNEKNDFFRISLQQNSKIYWIEEINNQKISSFKTDNSPIHSLKSFFVPKVHFKSRKIWDPEIKKSLNSLDLICNHLVFSGMSSQELLFVRGRPSQIRIPTSERDGIEEWIYNSPSPKEKPIIFELRNGKIYKWRTPQ